MHNSLMLPTELFEMSLLYMNIEILHFSGILIRQLLCTEQHADLQHNLKLCHWTEKLLRAFFPLRDKMFCSHSQMNVLADGSSVAQVVKWVLV